MKDDEPCRGLYELSCLVISILREMTSSPGDEAAVVMRMRMRRGGLAWMMLGISMAMMLCGWVTLVIGFMLLPWVVGFYLVGLVSSLSLLARSLFSLPSPSPSPSSPKKGIPASKFL